MKIRIELEIDVSNMIDENDGEERDWLFNYVLTKSNLTLFSNDIGDSVGEITDILKCEEIYQETNESSKYVTVEQLEGKYNRELRDYFKTPKESNMERIPTGDNEGQIIKVKINSADKLRPSELEDLHEHCGNKIDWESLRKDFFNECTNQFNGIAPISISSHDVFEWFKNKIEL